MTYFPRFAFPWALFLLLIVPWSIWLGMKIRSLTPGRKWAAITLRSIILICLIFALAGAEMVKKRDKLATFFLLDQSNSIPQETRLAAVQWVRDACDQFMKSDDEAGVIVFGDESSIELSVGPTLELDKTRSFVSGEQTDLAAAIRLAMAAFPQGYMRRIVILSDGNETRGSAIEEAKIADSAGVAIDVVPLNIGGASEVRMGEVTAPSQARADEPFQLRVVANASRDCDGTLRIFRRLKEGKQLLGSQKVTLQKGDNVFMLTQELTQPGFYEYEATIESEADTVMENNEGVAFTIVQGEPVVLYVDADLKHSIYLEKALITEGLKVVRTDPMNMPVTLAQLENYDVLILSNVSATELSVEQIRSLEAMVRDLGVGLVMIGGPDSFGAGGYLDTPVERALPVDMDIKQRKILPRGALVLILHTCEIPDGNVWAREIGLASLNVLASQDLMGALGYMYGGTATGDTWIYELQPVGDKSMMRQQLTRAATQIGDMPDVGPTMQLAYNALKNADAAVKRIIMISDGDPAAPTSGLLKKMAEAKISVSTICIAPHSPNDQNMLRWVAESTGGTFYFVTNPNNLPQIFTKEAAEVKRGILVEEPFTPQFNHHSELLLGMAGSSLPGLRGYVITTPKDKATVALVSHKDDPVLAHWRYGLGKSVAFTSDVTNRWAADWLAWEEFNKFWAQTIRWAMREVTPTNFQVETKLKDGMGYVKIDAVDEMGRFLNYLNPRGVVTGPAPDFKRHELDLLQTGPGIYEATFPLDNPGAYMVNLVYNREDGSVGMVPTGVALNYSPEYNYVTTNRAMLENIAALAGGKILAVADNPFEHNLEAGASITPIWEFLALLAACLLPLEIFFRRVVINFNSVHVWVAGMLTRTPLLDRLITMPEMKTAPVTGRYRAAVSGDAEAAPDDARASFGVAADRKKVPEFKMPIEITAADQPAAGRTEYTGKLLEAKKRAGKRRRKGVDSNEDKEKS